MFKIIINEKITLIQKYLQPYKLLMQDLIGIAMGNSPFGLSHYTWPSNFIMVLIEFQNPHLKEMRLKTYQIKTLQLNEYYKLKAYEEQKYTCKKLIEEKNKIHYDQLRSYYDNYFDFIYYHKHFESFVLGFFLISLAILVKLDLNYLWKKKCFFEKRLASIRGKFAELKYLNIDLKKVKKLVGISINEIQIGINNQILAGLYNYPITKMIFIPDTTISYTKNQLRHINPLIRHLK